MSRCTCSGCGCIFSSLRAFETHRIGAFSSISAHRRRRCMGEREMVVARLIARAVGSSGKSHSRARSSQQRVVWSLEDSLQRWNARAAIFAIPGTKDMRPQQRDTAIAKASEAAEDARAAIAPVPPPAALRFRCAQQ